MKTSLIILISFFSWHSSQDVDVENEGVLNISLAVSQELIGAWEANLGDGVKEVLTIAEGYWSSAIYNHGSPKFISTRGGAWRLDGSSIIRTIEYNTADVKEVGSDLSSTFKLTGNSMTLGEKAPYKRIDYGTPGALAGAYLITGRKRAGEIKSRIPGARKTMKILSGKRFQWIAYNTDTGEFFGTGGGTYSTVNGKYTENIEFFSRDNSRVGASLEFEFEMDLAKGEWHHSGLSSKGKPIYEVWTVRSFLDKM